MKIYKDSKEFPLYNYERIESTNNYFYMIKGYEDGDKVEANEEELKELFEGIIQDYVISLNSKNYDILQHCEINRFKAELMKFAMARDIISLHIRYNELGESVGVGRDNATITEMLRGLKIMKKKNLYEQIDVIDRKIDKIKNDILEAEKKLEKNNKGNESDADINAMVTHVELILERGIDMEKTTLYRFGIMQEQARKKIESQNKANG